VSDVMPHATVCSSIQTVSCGTMAFHEWLAGFMQAHVLYNEIGQYKFDGL
jgi:hypothetical protein